MYVDNETGKTVSAIDVSTLEVVRTYDLGFMPGMAATAPNGELWVTDADNGKVTVFNAQSTTKNADITTGAGAHALTFSGDGKTAYVTNQLADSVSVIEVAEKKVTKTITVGSKPNGVLFRSF